LQSEDVLVRYLTNMRKKKKKKKKNFNYWTIIQKKKKNIYSEYKGKVGDYAYRVGEKTIYKWRLYYRYG